MLRKTKSLANSCSYCQNLDLSVCSNTTNCFDSYLISNYSCVIFCQLINNVILLELNEA